MGIQDYKHKLFADLKRHTITKAQKEFSEKKDGAFVSDINFNFEPIKTGRKVTGLKFHIFEQSTKPKKELKQTPALPTQTGTDQEKSDTPEIQKMLSIGIAKKTALSLFEQYGVEYITEKLKITTEEDRPSPAGFFIKAVAGDWKSKNAQKKAKELDRRKKAQEKIESEKKLEAISKARGDLSFKFSESLIEKYLADYTEDQKKKKLESIKKEYPYVSKQIKSLYKGAGAGFLLKEIPENKEEREIFINAELKKMGLIKGGNQETDK